MHKPRLTSSMFALALTITLAAVIAGSAIAQSGDGCPGGTNCIDDSSFDSGLDGWEAVSVTAAWMPDHTLGIQVATGIAHLYDYASNADPISNSQGFYKTFYLQPGQYRLSVRAGQDSALFYNGLAITVRGVG
jgi:hypothetical protein